MTDTEALEGERGATQTTSGVAARSRIHSVTDAIRAGSILIEEGTPLPSSILLRLEPYSIGWSAVRDERTVFEKEVEKAGWTFFFMAGEIKTTVFGFDKQKALRAALKRLITEVKSQHCNTIEITRVTGKSFLRVPYVSVSAHPRHLQTGSVFSGNRNSNLTGGY
jgi:hypothetical protein